MSKGDRNARQQAAAAAAALRRKQREQKRRRFIWAGSGVAVVLVVVLVLVLVKVVGGGSSNPSAAPAESAAPEVVAAVTGVPAATLDQVGKGQVSTLPTAVTGQQPALTADGKPLVLYVGAEYCPFCAAQRWGMVVALSRFGSFTDLQTTHSASQDVFPNTATLSFHGSTYTSDFLTFQGVETETNIRSGSGYTELDKLTDAQEQTFTKFNAPPFVDANSAGAIPFIDFGNKFLSSGASFSPQLLAGKSASDISAALADPANPISQAVNGSANAFTAIICQLTGGQPGNVCTTPAVAAYQGEFGG